MQFQESITLEYLDPNNRVDEEKGILRGVKLLGENSKNGRRYLPEAMKRAVPLYEDTKLFVNHPEERSSERKLESWAGVFHNVRYEEGRGIFADAQLLEKSGYFDRIIEAAQKHPKAIGFSHVADGESRIEGNTELIESIEEVFSVDLVTDPATTAGFFESKDSTMAKKKTTIKQIIEDAPKKTNGLKRLMEMELAGEVAGDMPVEVEAESSPEDQIKAGLMAAINSKLENASAEEMRKVLTALGIPDSASKAASGETTEPASPEETTIPKEPASESAKRVFRIAEQMMAAEPAAMPTEDEVKAGLIAQIVEMLKGMSVEQLKAMLSTPGESATAAAESLRQHTAKLTEANQRIARLEAKSMLLESGREASDVRIRALAAASESDRKSLLESWPQKQTNERPGSSPPITESYDGLEYEQCDDPKKFAASLY